jgi:ParB family chromosome partitioning protein
MRGSRDDRENLYGGDVTPGKRKALGRGLAALIPGAALPASQETPNESASGSWVLPPRDVRAPRDGLVRLPIEDLHPGATQPRKTFDEARLSELADSVRTQGILQPLVVRPRTGGGGYEIIAGERRWRAAQKAGLHEVPALVRALGDEEAAEIGLVENLQREDLNPIDEAEGYQRLCADFGYTQEKLAARVGKDRSTIANALRLLKLPPRVRAMVAENQLSMGHARALLGLDSAPAIETLARQAIERNLSVRAVEALVRRSREPATPRTHDPAGPSRAARDLQERLQRALGTRVGVVEKGPSTGHLEISYHSLDELDRLLRILMP